MTKMTPLPFCQLASREPSHPPPPITNHSTRERERHIYQRYITYIHVMLCKDENTQLMSGPTGYRKRKEREPSGVEAERRQKQRSHRICRTVENPRRGACSPGPGSRCSRGKGAHCTWWRAIQQTPWVCTPSCCGPAATSAPSVGSPGSASCLLDRSHLLLLDFRFCPSLSAANQSNPKGNSDLSCISHPKSSVPKPSINHTDNGH